MTKKVRVEHERGVLPLVLLGLLHPLPDRHLPYLGDRDLARLLGRDVRAVVHPDRALGADVLLETLGDALVEPDDDVRGVDCFLVVLLPQPAAVPDHGAQFSLIVGPLLPLRRLESAVVVLVVVPVPLEAVAFADGLRVIQERHARRGKVPVQFRLIHERVPELAVRPPLHGVGPAASQPGPCHRLLLPKHDFGVHEPGRQLLDPVDRRARNSL
mmetsp:Transcript_8316/g.24931  ORF Transcript_8316/g.24931 Transcript_8316/m.24931 type:complete len:214 (-) Transcript_8316:493-1134(-)